MFHEASEFAQIVFHEASEFAQNKAAKWNSGGIFFANWSNFFVIVPGV